MGHAHVQTARQRGWSTTQLVAHSHEHGRAQVDLCVLWFGAGRLRVERSVGSDSWVQPGHQVQQQQQVSGVSAGSRADRATHKAANAPRLLCSKEALRVSL